MRQAVLTRIGSDDSGTFGKLVTDRGFTCFTGELPWRDNKRGESCIPAGQYLCLYKYSPCHQRNVYHLQDVLNRTEIEIHPGNWCGDKSKGYKSDVLGCIIVGFAIVSIDGQKGVSHSKRTLAALEDDLEKGPFTLTITEA